ncbi:MAG: hypothetical protein LUG44_03855 [Clostridiales bacterium]|nr:hypothetical protein [Clostridiales bacterium]
MGINTQTNAFLAALTKLVQESGLPPVNARLALDIIRSQLVELERAAVEREKQQEKKAEEVKTNG